LGGNEGLFKKDWWVMDESITPMLVRRYSPLGLGPRIKICVRMCTVVHAHNIIKSYAGLDFSLYEEVDSLMPIEPPG
jgi:hypothetical protein